MRAEKNSSIWLGLRWCGTRSAPSPTTSAPVGHVIAARMLADLPSFQSESSGGLGRERSQSICRSCMVSMTLPCASALVMTTSQCPSLHQSRRLR